MKRLTSLFAFFLMSTTIMAQQNDDYDHIIALDQFPYETVITAANKEGDKILLGKAYMARGEYYEIQNMKREAIREYKKALELDGKTFTYAQIRINKIKGGMNHEISEMQKKEQQALEEQRRAWQLEQEQKTPEERAAELAEALQTISNAFSSSKGGNSRSNNQNLNTDNGGGASYGNDNNNSDVSQNNTNNKRLCPICRGRKICISFSYAVRSVEYCHGKKRCQVCGGSGLVKQTFGLPGMNPCSYCNSRTKVKGDGLCGKCHGTGLCHNCNGEGYKD